MTPEKKVQNSIVEYFKDLAKKGHLVRVERREAGGLSYKKGMADLWAVYDGKHIEIEVKKQNGKRTPLQEKWEIQCKELNILYCLANSLQVVKNFMNIYFGIPD